MPVVVVDFDMPFGSMVRFMLKWAFASIPAALLLATIFGAAAYFVRGMLAATSMR